MHKLKYRNLGNYKELIQNMYSAIVIIHITLMVHILAKYLQFTYSFIINDKINFIFI